MVTLGFWICKAAWKVAPELVRLIRSPFASTRIRQNANILMASLVMNKMIFISASVSHGNLELDFIRLHTVLNSGPLSVSFVKIMGLVE